MDREHDATLVEVDDPSQPFIGQWNRLVSTTNWEKGRIIQQWRSALIARHAPTHEYSDEAWSLKVGGVSGQHVGRLRRVFDRFGETHDQFEGLYWSHFQSALDWDDAEMWLEGALQNEWSVAQMRRKRWETLGSVEADKPNDHDIVTAEIDEDFDNRSDPTDDSQPSVIVHDDRNVAEARSPAGPDFGDEDDVPSNGNQNLEGASIFASDDGQTVPFVRPFENLAELPDDLADAFEAFKLTILRHKADDWQQISRDDVLSSLEALKQMVLAPTVE